MPSRAVWRPLATVDLRRDVIELGLQRDDAFVNRRDAVFEFGAGTLQPRQPLLELYAFGEMGDLFIRFVAGATETTAAAKQLAPDSK